MIELLCYWFIWIVSSLKGEQLEKFILGVVCVIAVLSIFAKAAYG